MTFFEFIRSKGITQTQLADAMGCGRANISLWSTGEVFPTPSSIENIIKGFASLNIEVTYDEVFQALLYTKREKNNKEN
jgi:transcriptional regulator with XRE-family HTH domain